MSDTPIARPRPVMAEAQLRALANAAERANKPTWMLVVGVIVLVASLLYLLASYRVFGHARTTFARESAEAAKLDSLLGEYRSIIAKTPDFEKSYPQLPFMASQLDTLARQVWQLPDAKQQPTLPTYLVVGARVEAGALHTADQLSSVSVNCQASDQPLDKTFAWINAVQDHPRLKHAFVSQLTLSPATSGWQASLRFTAYEHK